jgi:hypothetical protein
MAPGTRLKKALKTGEQVFKVSKSRSAQRRTEDVMTVPRPFPDSRFAEKPVNVPYVQRTFPQNIAISILTESRQPGRIMVARYFACPSGGSNMRTRVRVRDPTDRRSFS